MDEMGAPTDQRLQRQRIFRSKQTSFGKDLTAPTSIWEHLETPYVKGHSQKRAQHKTGTQAIKFGDLEVPQPVRGGKLTIVANPLDLGLVIVPLPNGSKKMAYFLWRFSMGGDPTTRDPILQGPAHCTCTG